MGRSRAMGERSATTRDRIVDAALETIKQQGILGASARAIARAGGFNEPLIFYHFHTLDELLLAAVDKVNALRLTSYTPRLAAASPELSRALLERFTPWIRLLADSLTRVTRGTPFEGLFPAEEAAFALTAWFVGMELLSHPDIPARWEELLTRMQLVAAQLPGGGRPAT